MIGRELELAEKAMDKQAYLENCLDDLGGRRFSKDNVKPGYIIDIGRYGPVEVLSTGPKNVAYKILTGGAAGIANTLKLNDSMTGVLKSVMRSMQMTLRVMEDMDSSASGMDISKNLSAATFAARQAAAAVDGFEQELNAAAEAAKKPERNLLSTAKAAGIVAGAVYGIRKAFEAVGEVADLSDQFTTTTARLNLINDSLRTTQGLQDVIFASANRARSAYLDTADAVAQLGANAGEAFSGIDEIIAFSELMNKSFKVSGTDAQAQAGAMRQLTQALASGVLRGDEFNSIAEQAPMVYQAIADYMGKSKGEVRALAADGALSASVVKNAMFAAADDISERFSQIPQTWEDATTQMKNAAMQNFRPVLERINQLANSERFQQMTGSITMSLARMAGFALTVINILVGGAALIYDNWSWLSPLFWGLVTVLGAYVAILLIYNATQAISNGLTAISAAAKYMEEGATFAATAAQYGLNTALLACPLTWIILLIIALIAIFFAVIAAINHFAGTSISAVGVISGAFATAGAFIANLLLGLLQLVFGIIEYWWNGFAAVANFLGNVFNDPVGSVIHLFADMADNVLGVLEKIASAMDFLFGTSFAETVAGWRTNLSAMAESMAAEYGNGTYEKKVGKLNLNSAMEDLGLGLDRFNYGDAYSAGYGWGEKIDDKLSGISDNLGGMGDDMIDFSQFGNDEIDRVGSVGRIEDDVTISDEDIKMLKDLAARDYQVYLTQLTPSLVANFGDVHETADAEAILEFIEDSVVEALGSSLVVKR